MKITIPDNKTFGSGKHTTYKGKYKIIIKCKIIIPLAKVLASYCEQNIFYQVINNWRHS